MFPSRSNLSSETSLLTPLSSHVSLTRLSHTSLLTSQVIDYMLRSTGGQYRVVFAQRGRNVWFMHRSFVATAESVPVGAAHAGKEHRWTAPAALVGGGAPQHPSSVAGAPRNKSTPRRRPGGALAPDLVDVVTPAVAKTLGGSGILRKLLLGGLAAACGIATLCAALSLLYWANLCREVGR